MWTCDRNSIAAATAFAIGLVSTAHAQCVGEPASDSRCLPRVIAGAPGHYEVRMDVSSATPDLDSACGTSIGHTVWFEISPTEDSHITFSTCDPNTTYDTVVQGYLDTGDCEFPGRIDSWCEDDSPAAACENGCSGRSSIVTVQATAGTTYLFQVGSYNQNSAGCDLCLGVNVVIGATPPVNDDCFDAMPIGETAVAFDTTSATTDGPPLPESCDEGAGTPFIQDLWYRYTPTCTGVAMIDLCDSDYDTRLAVYEADQCPGAIIACNDDSCELRSRAQISVDAGTEYLIRVGGYDGSGTGLVSVSCAPNVYLDPSAFALDVAAAGYVEYDFEDFSEANLPPPPGEAPMDDPLDEHTDNGVFAPGDIASGLVLQSNVNGTGESGPAPRGGAGLIAATPITLPDAAVVAASVGPDGFDLISTLPLPLPRPAAIAIRVADIEETGELVVTVYDVNDALLSQVTLTGATDGAFVGATPISIPAPNGVEIGRINIFAPAGTREGVYRVTTYGPPRSCPADISGNGVVDFADILAILSAWGNGGGPEDIDNSGTVDFGDILMVLGSWGPCMG